MNVRISKGFLNVSDGTADDASFFFTQTFDFAPEVIVQFDVFQSKKLGLNRPLTRVTLSSALRLA